MRDVDKNYQRQEKPFLWETTAYDTVMLEKLYRVFEKDGRDLKPL
jgi:hypothetical protein